MSITRQFAVPLIALGAMLPLLASSAGGSRGAADAQDQEEQEPQVMTRVYSLRPLVAEARRQSAAQSGTLLYRGDVVTAPGGAAGGIITAAAFGEGDAQNASEVVTQVISIITSTVDPDSWQDNGGPTGTITYLPINSRLIVTHTDEVHQRVAKLIDELQARHVVSVRARLVRLPEARVEQSTRVVDGVALWQGEPTDLPMLAQVRFSGFDGQAQHAASGRSVGYFQSVQPVVAANAVGYQPSTSDLQTGLVLEATPILDVEGNSATLQINAQYILLDDNQPVGGHWQLAPASAHLRLMPHLDATTQCLNVEAQLAPATQPGAAADWAEGAWVLGTSVPVLPDRLSVHRRILETALRVPVGQWVLVGTVGASADGEPTQEEPLHLLIRIDAGKE